jgi:hypothetical protein
MEQPIPFSPIEAQLNLLSGTTASDDRTWRDDLLRNTRSVASQGSCYRIIFSVLAAGCLVKGNLGPRTVIGVTSAWRLAPLKRALLSIILDLLRM